MITCTFQRQLQTPPSGDVFGKSRPKAGLGRSSVVAFTLIEVILSIVIALGILVVLLYFYQQATNLRAQAIQETERIAAARLLMDRITAELRASRSESKLGSGFVGESNSIQFVKTDVPPFASWTGGALGRSTFPVTDLKTIRYRLQSSDGTNVGGLLRSEEPLAPYQQSSLPEDSDDQTNDVIVVTLPPVLEEIRFLQFRYWSGTNWLDSWQGPTPPMGVEVSLGAEPATNGMDLTEYPAEIFRRVVYLAGNDALGPVSAPSKQETAPAAPAEDAP